MDYAVHSWDIRQGSGRAQGLSGDAADLLVPFMFGGCVPGIHALLPAMSKPAQFPRIARGFQSISQGFQHLGTKRGWGRQSRLTTDYDHGFSPRTVRHSANSGPHHELQRSRCRMSMPAA
jgi:hypothetical protein